MKRIIKWFFVLGGGLLGLAVLGLAIVYLYMGYRFGVVHDVALSTPAIPADARRVAEGERLARIRGCMGGCHGRETEGSVFFEVPDGSRIIAPDLGRIAAEYTADELEQAIRQGVRPDGTSVVGIMPSTMFQHLGDDDLAAIIAFLQSRTPGDEALPEPRFGPLLRAMMVFYSWKYDWTALAAEAIDAAAPRLDPAADGPPLAHGRYLAMTVCTECHGDDLRGTPDGSTPSLAISAAYSREDFGRLMTTGIPVGGRELDLMKRVAVSRFAHLAEPEIDDLHAYLVTLAASN